MTFEDKNHNSQLSPLRLYLICELIKLELLTQQLSDILSASLAIEPKGWRLLALHLTKDIKDIHYYYFRYHFQER